MEKTYPFPLIFRYLSVYEHPLVKMRCCTCRRSTRMWIEELWQIPSWISPNLQPLEDLDTALCWEQDLDIRIENSLIVDQLDQTTYPTIILRSCFFISPSDLEQVH
jgi:hypothetical protein